MRDRGKKADIIIGAAVIVIGAALFIAFCLMRKPGNRVVVSVDGREVMELPLDVDTEKTIRGYSGGENRLVIRDGKASVTYADCPDRICVHQGTISAVGESIICLPHRVSIRIAGDDDEAPDAVTGCLSDDGEERTVGAKPHEEVER